MPPETWTNTGRLNGAFEVRDQTDTTMAFVPVVNGDDAAERRADRIARLPELERSHQAVSMAVLDGNMEAAHEAVLAGLSL